MSGKYFFYKREKSREVIVKPEIVVTMNECYNALQYGTVNLGVSKVRTRGGSL